MKNENVVNKNKCFPGKFLSGVSRLYSRLVNKETSLFYQQRISGRSRIKCGITPVFNNSAFTLIELLVVVLIIGILAAVALPKYQVAVTKARVARLMPLLKTLRDAQDAYYLSNGKYAFKFEELSIDIPTPKSITAATNTYGEIAVYDDYEIRICSSSQIAYVGTSDILLGWYLTESPDTDCDTKKLAIVKKSNKVANDVIRAMGGQEYSNGSDNYYCLP